MKASQRGDTAGLLEPTHIAIPKPDSFGLPRSFDANDYLSRFRARKARFERIVAVILYGLCYALISTLMRLSAASSQADDVAAMIFMPAWFSLFACAVILSFLKAGHSRFFHEHRDFAVRRYIAALEAYQSQVHDWHERQTELGLSFWMEKRGVAFEKAVEALLTRRGCSVKTTKASGDGGVDLIVEFGEATFWCQCKGHKSPIGVAVVRELAGVCSRGGGAPVVIAVNGYTKAASETARQLGVTLVDTHNLINIARQQQVRQWL